MAEKVEKSDQEWREELAPERFQVLRQQSTEPPFTGAYTYSKADGMYRCGACGNELFSSDSKYDSGSGWPSFTEPAVADAASLARGQSPAWCATEVTCARCGSQLGHVFPMGLGPRGSASASTRLRGPGENGTFGVRPEIALTAPQTQAPAAPLRNANAERRGRGRSSSRESCLDSPDPAENSLSYGGLRIGRGSSSSWLPPMSAAESRPIRGLDTRHGGMSSPRVERRVAAVTAPRPRARGVGSGLA